MTETAVKADSSTSQARVYFALWPDAATAQQLYSAAAPLRATCGGRAMQVDTLHLTLAFIGDIPRTQIPHLLALGGEVDLAAFSITIDMAALWARQHLVWGGPSQPPKALLELADQLSQHLQAAGVLLDRRVFKPHVTLIRRCEHNIAECAFGPVEWKVKSFVLVESLRDSVAVGARYRTLAKWPLG